MLTGNGGVLVEILSVAGVGAELACEPGKTGDVVELLEIPGGAILKSLGYGRKRSIPLSMTAVCCDPGPLSRAPGLDGGRLLVFCQPRLRSRNRVIPVSQRPPYFPFVAVRSNPTSSGQAGERTKKARIVRGY